jgi:valyl-tRNA synthetase
MPFVTEELALHLGKAMGGADHDGEPLTTRAWPKAAKVPAKGRAAAKVLEGLIDLVSAVRRIRGELAIPPDRKATILVQTGSAAFAKALKAKEPALLRLAQADAVRLVANHQAGAGEAVSPFAEGTVFLPLEGLIDVKLESARLLKERDQCAKLAASVKKKLENREFLANAPETVVESEKEKLHDAEERALAIDGALARLGGRT